MATDANPPMPEFRADYVLREVDALPADERACILEEAGMGYDEFVNAMMTPFVSEDLNARALQSVGVDPSEFRTHHIDWSREMQRRCMTCAVRSRCRRDLAADVFGLQYRHYCANAESLSEIVAGMAPRPLSGPCTITGPGNGE